jgi:predicted lactoylglutathione lyase
LFWASVVIPPPIVIAGLCGSLKGKVKSLLKRAETANGIPSTEAEEQSWSYAGYFRDLDGHMGKSDGTLALQKRVDS